MRNTSIINLNYQMVKYWARVFDFVSEDYYARIGYWAKELINILEIRLRAIGLGIVLKGSKIASEYRMSSEIEHVEEMSDIPKDRVIYQRFGQSTKRLDYMLKEWIICRKLWRYVNEWLISQSLDWDHFKLALDWNKGHFSWKSLGWK